MSMMYAIDPLDSIDSFSRCAVRLTALYQDKKLAVGSGVIAQIAGGRCLVRARHILSGRDPETSQPLRSDGALPNKIQVEGCNTAFAANMVIRIIFAGEVKQRFARSLQRQSFAQ
jgi:hypothetical protein